MAALPVFDDVDRIMQIMERAFDPAYNEAWNRRQVSDALLIGRCHCALTTVAGDRLDDARGTAAGFYLSRSALDEEELLLIAVDPSYRGRGVGTRLLRAFIDAAGRRGARRLFLEMRRNNPAARLYAAEGFRPIGSRPGYYRTAAGPLDAVTFEKVLP